MTLSKYVKSKGIRSVKALAEFIGCRPETLNGWWNREEKELLDSAIERYKESRK